LRIQVIRLHHPQGAPLHAVPPRVAMVRHECAPYSDTVDLKY